MRKSRLISTLPVFVVLLTVHACVSPSDLLVDDTELRGSMVEVSLERGSMVRGELLAVNDSLVLVGMHEIPPCSDPWSLNSGTIRVPWDEILEVCVRDDASVLATAAAGLGGGAIIGGAIGALLIPATHEKEEWSKSDWLEVGRGVGIGGTIGLALGLSYAILQPSSQRVVFTPDDATPGDLEHYARFVRRH